MSVVKQLEPLVSTCVKLMNRPKESISSEELIDLMKRVDFVLDNPEVDFKCDDIFNLFASLIVLLCCYLHFVEPNSRGENCRYLFKVFIAACSVVKGNWETGIGVFLLDPEVQEQKKINQFADSWIAYCKHRDRFNQHYERITRKIKSARSNYDVALDELIASLNEDSVQNQEKKYRMFSALCQKFELQIEELTKTFINFYNIEQTETEKIVKSNIQKMLGVIVNRPIYAYIFPVYVFLMFVKKPQCILPTIDHRSIHQREIPNRKAHSTKDNVEREDATTNDNAFYTKLSLFKNMKDAYSVTQYMSLMNEITDDILDPLPQRWMEQSNNQTNQIADYSLILYPLLSFQDIYNAIANAITPFGDEKMSDKQLEILSDQFDRLINEGSRSQKAELKHLQEYTPEMLRIWEYIEKVVDIFSEHTYIYLFLGELPATKRINDIKTIYQLLFPKKEMHSDIQTEKKVPQLLAYFNEIATAINVSWANMNMIAFQNLIAEYNNQCTLDYNDPFAYRMEWMLDELQKGFEKQRLVYMKGVPGEYRIDRATRTLALFIQSLIMSQNEPSLSDCVHLLTTQIIGKDKSEDMIDYIYSLASKNGEGYIDSNKSLLEQLLKLIMLESENTVSVLDCVREVSIKYWLLYFVSQIQKNVKSGGDNYEILQNVQRILQTSADEFLVQKKYLFANVFKELYLELLALVRRKMICIIGLD